MAITPKTAAAGAIGIGGSGAAIGVTVHKLSQEKITLLSIKESPSEGTIGKAIKDASFELLTEEEKYNSVWEKIKETNTNTPKEEIQKSCKELLNTEISKDANKSKYQEAIKKCTKSRTFVERAKEIGFDVLEESEKEKPEWGTKWSDESRKGEIKSVLTDQASQTDWSNVKAAAVTYCKETNNKKIHETFTNTDWQNFLKVCAKSKTKATDKVEEIDKDFWTRKDTYRTTITKAKFSLPTADKQNCTSLLNKAFEEVNEDYKNTTATCIESNTFENRVTQLSLAKLNTENQDNDWNTKWTNKKSEISKIISSVQETQNWSDVKTAVQSYCTSKHSTAITKQTTNKDWHNYLTVCIKEDATNQTNLANALKNDFWTNQQFSSSN